MLDLDELVRRWRANALRRRVGRDEIGVRLLERDELVVELVVLGVRDLRIVEDVVAVEVVVEDLAQLGGAFVDVFALEDAIQLLGVVDDCVGVLRFEPLARMDPAPRDGDGEHAAAFAALTSNGASPRTPSLRLRAEPLEREQQWLRVGLVALGLVAADDRLEQCSSGIWLNASVTVLRRFAVTMPSRRPSSFRRTSRSSIAQAADEPAWSGSLCAR